MNGAVQCCKLKVILTYSYQLSLMKQTIYRRIFSFRFFSKQLVIFWLRGELVGLGKTASAGYVFVYK